MTAFPDKSAFFDGVDRVADITSASTVWAAAELATLTRDGHWAIGTNLDNDAFLAVAKTIAGSLQKHTFAGSLV